MRKVIVVILILGSIACNNQQDTNTTNTDTAIYQSPAPVVIVDSTLQGCYLLINGKDTASLELGFDKGNVSGSLSYNIYGKDRNDGTFEGEINGDLLKVWYLFRSEGIMSVRQEIWKIVPGKLIPATGEVTVKGDTSLFTNTNKLIFDNNRAFVKVKCII
ncbi:MAG TPA: hypothetical protein VF487_18940 [Chitinophagaceae bacterium]